MDPSVIEAFEQAGIDTTFDKHIPTVGIRTNDRGQLVPLATDADEVGVVAGKKVAMVKLKKISELWTGSTQPPDFDRGPTPAYVSFFAMIELTAADFCSCTGRHETDQEFLRLYTHLRRRPDGTDASPQFAYLQAAARLYLSLRDISQAEFDAVVRRLTRSARTFSEGYSSTNYLDSALTQIMHSGSGRHGSRRGAA